MRENGGNGTRLTAHLGFSAILRSAILWSAKFHIHWQIEMFANEGGLSYGSFYIRARFSVVVACPACMRMDIANRRVMPYGVMARRSLSDLSAMENHEYMRRCEENFGTEYPRLHLDMIIQKPIANAE